MGGKTVAKALPELEERETAGAQTGRSASNVDEGDQPQGHPREMVEEADNADIGTNGKIFEDEDKGEIEEEYPEAEDADVAADPTPGKRRPWFSGLRGVMLGMGIGIAIAVGGMRFLEQPTTGTNADSSEPASSSISGANSPTPKGTDLPAPTLTVTAGEVESAAIARTLEATGTVAAYDLLPVLPQSNGLRIEQVLVDEGDYVEAGQVMAVLDDSVQRSQISDAEAQLESARSVRREREAAIGQAEAGVSQARAGATEAEAAVSQALAAQAETEAAVSQSLAAESEAEAAVAGAIASKAEAEAGLEQAQANLASARIDRDLAQKELQRYQELADAGAIGRQELDSRRREADNAEEAVRVARANIKSAEARIQSAEANASSARARLDSARANVSSTRARLKSAGANVSSAQARLKSAIANISNAQARVDSAIANLSNAQANIGSNRAKVEREQTQLEQTLVRAPASGTVAERIARIGDVTGGSKMLFSIIKYGELELQVKVPETQLPRVKVGAPVAIASDADSRINLRGTVREIAPLVDEETRQATVKVNLPSSELLRPGMFLRAALTTSEIQGITAPAKSILPQADGSSIVYLLGEDDIVRARTVEIGEIIEGNPENLDTARVEIKSGLNLGDRLVVAGAGYLKDGDRVKVVNSDGE